MSYRFQPDRQYLMPTHFGPMSGPRARPDGSRFPDPDDRIKETYSVGFKSDPDRLKALLPEGFELFGDPVVTVTFSYMTNIAWLAGRGYNMLGVTIPARLKSGDRFVVAPFLLVLWENMTDPIITGREQLGFNKVFCDLPEPMTQGNMIQCEASWMGHVFAKLNTSQMAAVTPQPPAPLPEAHERASLLHLQYFPQMGDLTKTRICEPAISPAASGRLEETRQGIGSVEFFKTRWEDMPTQFHIIEALRDLPSTGELPAVYQRTRGGTDHFRQRGIEGPDKA